MTESRKTVTVLHCEPSVVLDGEADRSVESALMDRLRPRILALIEGSGGRIEQTIGDAVVAVFGVPLAHEDDALRAVVAAARLRELASEATKEAAGGAIVEVACSVNTSDVLVDDEGHLAGDAVATAGRLAFTVDPGDIVVGSATRRLIGDAIEVEGPAPGPIPVFRFIGMKGGGERSTSEPVRRLVGRDREMQALLSNFEEAASGRCRVAIVVGDAGVGKSRLVKEVLSDLSSRALVVTGRSLPQGGDTFAPALHAIATVASLDGLPPEEIEARLLERLSGADESDLIATRLAALLGVGGDPPSLPESSWAIRRFFETIASSRPLVLSFEDLHWGTDAFIELIQQLTTWSADSPILVLGASRRRLLEERPDLVTSDGSGPRIVLLKPLDADAATTLVGEVLGEVDEDLRRRVASSGAGNPLFIEQLIAMLVDTGKLTHGEDGWKATADLKNLRLPSSTRALLSARLDSLDENERIVAQRASMPEPPFVVDQITPLLEGEGNIEVSRALLGLAKRDLLVAATSNVVGRDAFEFGHALIRDAAYESMTKELRSSLHEKYAGVIEAAVGPDTDEAAGFHLERAFLLRRELGLLDDHSADLRDRAAEALSHAAGRALDRRDMDRVRDLLERTVVLLPHGEERLAAMLLLSEARVETDDLEGARRLAYEARIASDEANLGVLGTRARVLELKYANFASETGADDLLGEADSLRSSMESAGDDMGLVQLHYLLAEIHMDAYRPASAAQEFEIALGHAQKAGARYEANRMMGALGACAFWGPQPVDDALARVQELLAMTDDRSTVARHHLSLAGLLAMQGDYEKARALVESTRKTLADLGQASALSATSQAAGTIELLAGNLDAADKELSWGLERYESSGALAYAATNMAMLAEVAYRRGELVRAEELTRAAEAAGDDPDLVSAEWAPVRAKVFAATGRTEEALELATTAVEQLRGGEEPRMEADALMALGEVLERAGRSEEAAEATTSALENYASKGIASEVARARAFLDRIKAGQKS